MSARNLLSRAVKSVEGERLYRGTKLGFDCCDCCKLV